MLSSGYVVSATVVDEHMSLSAGNIVVDVDDSQLDVARACFNATVGDKLLLFTPTGTYGAKQAVWLVCGCLSDGYRVIPERDEDNTGLLYACDTVIDTSTGEVILLDDYAIDVAYKVFNAEIGDMLVVFDTTNVVDIERNEYAEIE